MSYRIEEIAMMKTDLEIANRRLIEENYELELTKDNL